VLWVGSQALCIIVHQGQSLYRDGLCHGKSQLVDHDKDIARINVTRGDCNTAVLIRTAVLQLARL
jgi:hypothetical protein